MRKCSAHGENNLCKCEYIKNTLSIFFFASRPAYAQATRLGCSRRPAIKISLPFRHRDGNASCRRRPPLSARNLNTYAARETMLLCVIRSACMWYNMYMSYKPVCIIHASPRAATKNWEQKARIICTKIIRILCRPFSSHLLRQP